MRFMSAPLVRRREGHRGYVDYEVIKQVRDRGLDHVVEREKHLKPLLALKDLIKSEASKSLPITTITRRRDSLGVPFRPMDFFRRYPSVFEEFLPGGPPTSASPHSLAKKAESDTLLVLGQWLGIRARVKRALLHHPGIFYFSSKTGTCNVLLKEAYKRGLLIEKNQLTDIRNQYMHLMKRFPIVSAPGDGKQQETGKVTESNGPGGNENGGDPAERKCNIDESQDDCGDYDQECSTSDEDQKEVENIPHTQRNFKSSEPVNADRRARGRDFGVDRTARVRDFDADRRGRGGDLDADKRGRGRGLDADRRGSCRDFGADRRGRVRSFDAARPSRNSERTIVSEKNHSKTADKEGTQRISSPWEMHAKDGKLNF